MISRRHIVVGLVTAAAILLVGRVMAVVYTDYAWYRALGATALWKERVRDIATIHVGSAIAAGGFALLNLSAIRRSIVSLSFPRRIGNVEFGEAVPRRYLDRFALLLATAIAGVMSIVAPRWQQLALVRTGVEFGERDPFFQMDLGFYTAWLPLEHAVYMWFLILLVVVMVVVTGLYALTPSLRWQKNAFYTSVHVRRHLAVLGAMLLLAMAWSYRLHGYELLIEGSGSAGAFSYIDHQWLIPAYLSLSVGTVAAAALVLASGWTGQVRASFFTVSAVLVFSVAFDLVLPFVVRRFGRSAAESNEAPYEATRRIFTRRAYGLPAAPPLASPREITRFAAFSDSLRTAATINRARANALVYPGATGIALIGDGAAVQAPALGKGLLRLAHSWSEQRLDLAWNALPETTKIVRTRDVRERISALMPVFAQGSELTPAYIADTLFWVAELYSASSTYPLSRHYRLAGEERSYLRHMGTALVNSRTGRVKVVPVASPDPISAAWRMRFPGVFRAGIPDILDELRPTPSERRATGRPAAIAGGDSVFRAEVSRLYARMRGALAAGDLKAFGDAYDSLGTVIGRE